MESLEQAVAKAAHGELRSSHNEASQTFVLTPEFIGFQGHFPGAPVLPAFVQTLMGRHVLQTWLGHERQLKEVDRAKFKQPIGPGELQVRCKRLNEGHLVQLETDQGLAASFLLFTEPAQAARKPA